jgi:hypothetical protein
MNCLIKFSVLPAIVVALFNAQVSSAQLASSQSDLQATIRVVPNGVSNPRFEVELSNIGKRDLVLNLGFIYADQQYANSIHLILRNAQNSIDMLDLAGPPIVSGRIDPFIVPLPKSARISLPIDLAGYWIEKRHVYDIHLQPGQYFLSAEYRGEKVSYVIPEINPIHCWSGRVKSTEISFVIPEK